MSSEPGENRRSLMGFWVRPKSQALLAMCLCLGFVAIGLILLGLSFSLETFLQDLAASNQVNPQTALALTGFVTFYIRLTIGMAALFALLSLLLGLVISHRIYGPIVAIRHHIGHLMRGDFSSRVRTRDNDEFPDLVDDLNNLAAYLEKNK